MSVDIIKIFNSKILSSVDLNRIKETVKYYTNDENSVVIFENGTAVFPPLGNNAWKNAVSIILNETTYPAFKVRLMDDENFVVSFGEYAFCIVFEDIFSKYRSKIYEEINSSGSQEIILGGRDSPKDHMAIGILARTWLCMDRSNPKYALSIGTSLA